MLEHTKHNILYIHGFNSSPLSQKAENTRKYLDVNFPNVGFFCPQLKTTPNEAINQLIKIIDDESALALKNGFNKVQWYFIGSSLGGYFASYLSNKYNYKAVLVNPAIKPFELMIDYLGEQTNPYTNEVYQVLPEHIDDLKKIEPPTPEISHTSKNNFFVMVQTGDEVLDYQQAVDKYQHCQVLIEQNGDHSFIDYEKYLPNIIKFFQLS